MWPGDWGQLQQLQKNSLYSFDYKNAVCVSVHVRLCVHVHHMQSVCMHSTHVYVRVLYVAVCVVMVDC